MHGCTAGSALAVAGVQPMAGLRMQVTPRENYGTTGTLRGCTVQVTPRENAGCKP